MANYYLNDDGTTSLKNKRKGKNFIMQDDGTTIENTFSNNNVNNNITRKKQKEESKSFLDNAAYIGKKGLSGALSGITGIADAGLQEIQNSLKKGENIKSTKDLEKQTALSVVESFIPIVGQLQKQKETNDRIKEIWKNKDKSTTSKIVNTALETITGGSESMSNLKGVKDSLTSLGAVDNSLDEKVQKVQKKVDKPSEKYQKKLEKERGNYSNTANFLGDAMQSVGNMAPSLAATALSKNPNLGIATMAASAKGQSTKEALQNGADLDTAIKIGNAKALTEVATEKMTGGLNFLGKGALDDVAESAVNKYVRNKGLNFLAKQGIGVAGEGLEEVTSDIIGTLIDKGTIDPNANYTVDDLKNTLAQTGVTTVLLNSLTGGYTPKAYRQNANEMQQYQEKNNPTLPTGQNEIQNTQVQENPLVNNTVSPMMPLDESTVQSINNNSQRYIYHKSDNSKIDNLRQSASQYLNNSGQSQSFIQTAEKVINDKGYNIVLDNTLSSPNGNQVNGQIKTLDNGEIEIRINPNSDRAGEFLLTHEITHAIETKDMVDLVMDYASKNKDFNNALESLKQTYGTEDVSSEILADISGQLFGNEEFINTLSMNKPNIFKRIYNSIVSLANKITGNSKESLFIKDLKNKWETAYRNNQNNLSKDTEYMMTGKKGTKNLFKATKNRELLNNYNEALKMDKNKYSKDYIRKQTGWYKDVNGDWKFEISDKDAKLKIRPKSDTKYKLGDVLNHSLLYKMYPSLKNVKVVFKDLDSYRGKANKITGTLYLNNNLIGNTSQIEKTLLHEIQHNIQSREHFQNGTTKEAEGSYEKYKNNFGEAEARETANRKKLTFEERVQNPSETQLYDNNSKNKLYTKEDTKWYYYLGGDINVEETEANFKKNLSQDNVGGINEENVETNKNQSQDTRKTNVDENSELRRVNERASDSSFSYDKNVKQYEDLKESKYIEFRKKDNGDIYVSLKADDGNLINEFSLWSRKDSIKQLGEDITNYIYDNSTNEVKSITLENKKNTISEPTTFKEKQLDIINKTNPMLDDVHVGIRTVEDILDFSDTINDEESFVWGDFSREDAKKALEKGKITIYSSYPIKNGVFVSTSKIQAEEYAGGPGSKVFSKEVPLNNVAWISGDEGQFAKVDDSKYSKDSDSWQEHLEENYKSKGTKSNFEDMRLRENVSAKDKIIDKETSKINKQYEKTKKENKKIITKEAARILEFDDYKQKQEFTDLLSEYYDNPDFNKIKQDIKDKFSEKRIEYVNEELKDIKNQIRKTKLKVDDNLKKSITDYKFFRQDNFGNLKLNKEGRSIDSFYNEMADMYPSVFDKNITNETDQLYRLSDFMNEDTKLAEKYNLDDESINQAAQYIYDSINNKDSIDDLINSISVSPKQIRKVKTAEYREFASNFLENSNEWKDKKMGLSYKTNTMKRNFYDVMDKKDAKRVYDNFINPIFEHNSQMQKDISNYNKRISNLNLNEKESQAVQMFGEYKYNPETLVTGPEVDKFISDNKIDYKKIKNAVEVFRNTYDELIERVNTSLREQGYKEIDYRKGYFPHFVDEHAKTKFGKVLEKMGWKFRDDSVPTDIAGITDTFKPGKVWNRNAQQRKGKYTDFNALKGFDTYVRGAMETIYFTEDIQKLRALENEIRYQHSENFVQQQIDEIMSDDSLEIEDRQDKIDKIFAKYTTPLNNFVTELRDYTNSIANKKSVMDRTMEQATNRKVYSVMTNVSNRLSANMVGLNLSSAITNFIPITQATSQVKSKYLLKGLKESIKNQTVNDGFENKSVFLTSRLNQADRLYKTKLESFSEKANFMFDGIDSITSNVIVRGKYYENIAKGMSEFNAMRNADEFARDLMAGRTKGEMPTIFNSKNPLIKLFTSFQLEVNNQYQYMLKDLPRDLSDEAKTKLLSAFIKMFVGAWLYNQLTEKVVGRKSAFSPADTLKEIYDTSTNKNLKIADKSSAILENLTQDIPFVGSLAGGGRLPISSVANPLNVVKGESTVKDELKKLEYYTVLPFGGGQLKKTIEGASMYVNNKDVKGSYTSKGKLRFEAKKDPITIGKNILFGQYSSKEAQDYFNKGYLPVDEKTLGKLKEKNISVTEYRKYSDDSKELKLNKIQSDKDKNGKSISGTSSGKKAYLIMKSNFSEKEKNYMLSKLGNSKDPVTTKELKTLSNDEKTYKFYFGMNSDNRKKFKEELSNYNISSDKLIDYYTARKKYNSDYTSSFAKEKMMDYISNSNLDEKTKWYLYNKDYGSDTTKLLVDTFNIKTNDYFNTMKYASKIKSEYSDSKYSKLRKSKVFDYINKLNIPQKEKIVLFSQAGYSSSTSKQVMYDYINKQNLTKKEKETIWKALY